MRADQFHLHAEIEDRHWWFCARREIVAAALETVVAPNTNALVLEVGLGTGGNLRALREGYRVAGVDIDATAVELARGRLPGAEVRVADATTGADGLVASADAILMLDVLEHVADDRGFLRGVVEAARPGAHLLLTVPADPRLWSPHDEHLGHERRYTEPALRAVWADLPVDTLGVTPFNARLYPVVRAVRTVSSRVSRTAGRAGTDLSVPPAPLNDLLRRLFAGERPRVLGALRQSGRAYRHGVSLMALLRRAA